MLGNACTPFMSRNSLGVRNAYDFIYLMDERMSSVILTNHMYDMNTAQDDRESMEGGSN